jgi:serine/threonine protein kinase
MDSSLRHLIERMLDKDPKRRATLEGVMSHEWITREGIEPMEPIFHPNLNAKYVSLFSCPLSPCPLFSGLPVSLSPVLPVPLSPCLPVSCTYHKRIASIHTYSATHDEWRCCPHPNAFFFLENGLIYRFTPFFF